MERLDLHLETLSASAVNRRMERGEIDLAPEYQRGKVWTKPMKALLIDSMIKGYDLPKLYVRAVPNGTREVVDGQQRLTAISAFFNDEVALPKQSGDFAGKKYSQLPAEIQDDLNDFQLHFSVMTGITEEEVRDMFLRLQGGKRLNAAEELNAIPGGMNTFVRSLADLPFFTEKVSFSNGRGAHRHVAAQLSRLAINGMGDVRKDDLLAFYRTHSHWEPNDEAKRLRRVIEFAGDTFGDKDPTLSKRGKAVSFVFGIYTLWQDLEFRGHGPELYGAFRKFDERVIGDDRLFADYRVALSHSSDAKASLETRHHFVMAAIAQGAPELPRRDPKRTFSYEERVAMYYRDGGVCQSAGCGKSVPFTEFHADHIEAWTHGGPTTLANAQVLCATHNLAKGAK